MTRFARNEDGQALLLVLALVGLVAAVAYGYAALASTAGQQSTLRAPVLADERASDAGAVYALWYAANKGFPPAGALVAVDPGDGKGAPSVTVSDLRASLGFGPLHSKGAGPSTYDGPATTLVGNGDVFFTFTWSSDNVGRGALNIRFDTTPTQPVTFAPQASVTMPAGALSTTSTVNLPLSGPGTYYLHLADVTAGPDTHLASTGAFRLSYPGMEFQAISVRGGQTTALDAGLTRRLGVYTATVNSWTLR